MLETVGQSDLCRRCGTTYTRRRGATIAVNVPGQPERVYHAWELEKLLAPPRTAGTARCEVQDWAGDERLRVFGRFLGRVELLGPPRPGQLTLAEGRLRFDADQGRGFDLPLTDITSIQLSAHALQLKVRGEDVFSVRVLDVSPRLWEERLHAAMREAFAAAGLGEIVEFHPRVCTRRPPQTAPGKFRFSGRIAAARALNPQPPWQYRLCCWIGRTGWRRFGGGIEVEGLENVPERGPFIAIANHQSYLETFLVPSVLPRTIQAMAKSTQFKVPILGWIMARIFAFPVRRFEVDPHAVRYMLRRMSEGYGILIFIEGERTWNGRVQPGRRGVARIALRTGVPVIPVRVTGAYEAWPRWAGKPVRHPIRIAFGPRLDLPFARTRQECEDCLDAAMRAIQEAIEPPLPDPIR